MLDSLGNNVSYNAVHWDGSKWELKRILYKGGFCVIRAIFAFDENDIWFSGYVRYLNGKFIELSIPDVLIGWGINKLWGNSSNDIYAVGSNGNIAHYQNGVWRKVESGTTTNLNDIWGISDLSIGNSLILTTVSSRYQLGDYKLLSISGNTATEYFSWPYTRLYGVWFNSTRNIYVVGDGAYVYKNNYLKTIDLPTNYFLTRVKGNALNDIYISTSGAEIIHYNGISWKEMSDGIYGKYEGLDVKGGTVVLVGYNIEGGIVGKAIITLGKHY